MLNVDNSYVILSVLMDKNRNASYTFTNGQYVCGSKVWYPPPSSTQEDWTYHEEPVPARPHDAWQMKLSGSMPGLKGNTRVTVTIEGYAKQAVDMYRDVKAVLFPGKPGINVFICCKVLCQTLFLSLQILMPLSFAISLEEHCLH